MQDQIFIIGGVVALLVVAAAAWVFGRHRGPKGDVQTSQLASKLKSEQLKSNIIFNAIEDGVVLIDDQQTISLLNPAGASVLGWERSEAEGLDWRSVFTFTDSKGNPLESPVPIEQAFTSGKPVRENNVYITTKSNKASVLAMTISPLLREGDTTKAVVGVFRDVSEERKEEAQRAEFISTASHEMRTPVAAIEGYLALALNEKVSTIDARARSYLDKAHESTRHLGKLFQDLLTSAKAEDGRLSNHPAAIEVGELLEGLTEDFRFTAEKKGLQMLFTLGAGKTIDASNDSNKVVRPLYYVHVDPERIREVITNLFDNAIKYTESGKITIGLTGNKDVVQFYVQDTGDGIPKEDLPHLFQKFYRVDNSSTRTIGGTGLGLFICRKIVELYGGRIWVASEVGKGSTFYINLPRIDNKRAQELRANEKEDVLA